MGLVLFASGAWWIAPSNASKVPDFEVPPKQHSPVISPAVPDDLALFGEPVPLDRFGVVEALDRELIVNTYRHSCTMLYLKRAARWELSGSDEERKPKRPKLRKREAATPYPEAKEAAKEAATMGDDGEDEEGPDAEEQSSVAEQEQRLGVKPACSG